MKCFLSGSCETKTPVTLRLRCDQFPTKNIARCQSFAEVSARSRSSHSKVVEQSQTDFSRRLSLGHSQKTRYEWQLRRGRRLVGDQSPTSRQSVADHLHLRPCCDQSAIDRRLNGALSATNRSVGDWSATSRRSDANHFQACNDCLPFQRL